jgi:hypothetical protein
MAYNAVILSIYIVILTILLRFLWNEVLVTHVTVLKRVDTLWHTFLLAVAVAMFRG